MKAPFIYSMLNLCGLAVAATYPIWRYKRNRSNKWVSVNGWLGFVIWWDLGEFCGEMLFLREKDRQILTSIIFGESLRAVFPGLAFGLGLIILVTLFLASKKLVASFVKAVLEKRESP